MTEFACWKCMKRRVIDPGSMCIVCFDASERVPHNAKYVDAMDHVSRYPISERISSDQSFRRWSEST